MDKDKDLRGCVIWCAICALFWIALAFIFKYAPP